MTRFSGSARLTDRAGNVITDKVAMALDDDAASAPSYVRGGVWYGEIWVDEGDLMIDPLQDDPRCALELSNGKTGEATVNSWDNGGRRVQVVGEGDRPF